MVLSNTYNCIKQHFQNFLIDNEDIPNVNDIENDTQSFIENFNEMHLNNFEFMKNSDSYIEDKVYNNIKLKV
jgi:hypothetical protein